MGAYGTGLYQDDVAADVRDSYINELKKGRDNEEITEELIEKYAGEINDSDDSTVFWLALADTQWKNGRLLEKVKIKALRCSPCIILCLFIHNLINTSCTISSVSSLDLTYCIQYAYNRAEYILYILLNAS